jgi:probable rRNA maturation factor
MIDVEVFGASARGGGGSREQRARSALLPALAEVRHLCKLATASAGVHDGHLAIEFVDAERITHLNREYRDRPTPTDVLSFPVDGAGPSGDSARELGDVIICPEHTVDVREAIVHGVLHLVGMDHELDNGEMLALQRALLAQARR